MSDDTKGFAINAMTGVVSVAGNIDYETAQHQNITVIATDIAGLSTSQTFTVDVTNVNEAPTSLIDTDVLANNIHKTAAIGTAVGITAHAIDPDADDTMTYSLVDNANDRFAIDATTGVVTVADELGSNISHDITVKATDAAGLSITQHFTVSVDTTDLPVVDESMNIIGSAGDDLLFGKGSADVINGGQGNDVMMGAAGNDSLQGNQGNDRAFGGEGDDYILGGKDNDQGNGNTGNDTLNGNLGEDTLHGGKDNDMIYGGQGNDQLYGDAGNDTLSGDMGVDYLFGGEGNDVFSFTRGSSTAKAFDTVGDFMSGEDKIDLTSYGFTQVQLVSAGTVNNNHDSHTLVLEVQHQNNGSTFISNASIDFGLNLQNTDNISVSDFLL